ncbi:MAG: HAD hydrolase-like protein [Candidatus Liptonbacteria bacterium]|nr:HAD hydrolase-like protein [Candidatus Liptonbacteria bacterium]
MNEVKVICFDLWNTLIRTTRQTGGYESVLVRLGVKREEIYPWVRRRCMTGENVTYDEMVKKMFDHFFKDFTENPAKYSNEIEEAKRLWRADNDSAIWFKGAQAALRTLREKEYFLVLLTNTTWMGWVDKQLNISPFFHHALLSCETHVTKPQPFAWENVMSLFPGVPPRSFLMVGDSEDDVAVPAQMGWRTVKVGKQPNFPEILKKIEAGGDAPKEKERVLLLDEGVCSPEVDDFRKKAQQWGLRVADATSLTLHLLHWRGWTRFNSSTSLVLFPGAGARLVDELLFFADGKGRLLGTPRVEDFYAEFYKKWLGRRLYIPAKRHWTPGTTPRAEVGRIAGETDKNIGNVIVVDDVICSGATMNAVRTMNAEKFPNAQWHALSWLKQRSAVLEGFASVFGAEPCGTHEKKAATVSFSTLRTSKEVAQNFAKDIKDSEGFLRFIADARFSVAMDLKDPNSID